MSAGSTPGRSSPSFGKVILVPAFQPGLTSIVRIFSTGMEWPLGSTRVLVTFIFF